MCRWIATQMYIIKDQFLLGREKSLRVTLSGDELAAEEAIRRKSEKRWKKTKKKEEKNTHTNFVKVMW